MSHIPERKSSLPSRMRIPATSGSCSDAGGEKTGAPHLLYLNPSGRIVIQTTLRS